MEAIFSWLFKYRPFFFREGTFGFQPPIAPGWLLVIGMVGAILLVFLYQKQLFPLRLNRSLLWTLRAGCLLGLIALLAGPCLTISTLVPQQSMLAVMVDNSKSMGISDSGLPRAEALKGLLARDSEFTLGLAKNFRLRQQTFDRQVRPLDKVEELTWSGEQTDIGAALQAVLAEGGSLPIGAVLLFSDGADNSRSLDWSVIDGLAEKGIPIHTVGVGPVHLRKDAEILSVSAPDRVLPNSSPSSHILIRSVGLDGEKGRLELREDGHLVDSQEIEFTPGAQSTTAEFRLAPKTGGVKTYEFRIVPISGEEITENNSRQAVVHVTDSKPRILYVEGRPRWEYKFLRQAFVDDKVIQLESLLRTAINKFYRQGIEDETSLASGFPTTKEALFQYSALLLGDLESAFFSFDQMELIRDFVGTRGGGLMMLGGGSTFKEGGYQNTPIEEVLPVWLNQGADETFQASYGRENSRPELTLHGEDHNALRLSQDSAENLRLWESLPHLTDRNRIQNLKSGATILANLVPVDGKKGNESPLLVTQRFGRGQVITFLSGSSWRWQMLMDHSDQSHETFWRQLLRWLVISARDPVTVILERQVYAQKEPIRIQAGVHDSSFQSINDAEVKARVSQPDGVQEEVILEWDAQKDGVYRGEWASATDGLHRIEVDAVSQVNGQLYGSAVGYFLSQTGQEEYFDSAQKVDFLRKISEETKGRYYDLSEVERIPEELLYSDSNVSVTETLELWNMPINLLILIGLLAAEWGLRKRQGMV